MPTHRQQSFIGTLTLQGTPLHALDTLLGKPAWVNWFGGGGVLPGLVSTVRNDSHFLSCQPGVTDTPIALYFRHTESGYALYVREPGRHFGKGGCLFGDYLGLGATADRSPSVLTLETVAGAPTGLPDLSVDTQAVRLALNGRYIAPVARRNTANLYLSFAPGAAPHWTLTIQERNVPWLSTPDER
jgi:hypothetical protein